MLTDSKSRLLQVSLGKFDWESTKWEFTIDVGDPDIKTKQQSTVWIYENVDKTTEEMEAKNISVFFRKIVTVQPCKNSYSPF